jgi:hypothetical protein
MQSIRYCSRLMLLAGCCMLASCIDGREEFWLASDGSGRAEIHYDVPSIIALSIGGEEGMSKLLNKFIRETPALTNATCQVTRKADRIMVDCQASFKSVLELVAAVRGNPALAEGDLKSVARPLIGQVDCRQSGRRVEFTRTVSPFNALPGLGFMPGSQFDGRRLVYILHLPVVALESNATRTADAGRTLIWDQALQDGLNKSLIIKFKAELPVPWWMMAAAVVVLALLGWLGISGIRKHHAGRPFRCLCGPHHHTE